MNKPILPDRRTNPLVWLAGITCTFLTVAVIITGIIVFSVYMIYKPKVPYISVGYAHLDRISYAQSGLLDTKMTLTMLANNNNSKAHATFSNATFKLQFAQTPIARLRADTFEVAKNSSFPLLYEAVSSPVPLDMAGMDEMDKALKQDRIKFGLIGQARTRWRVGAFLSVTFWTHLACELQFTPSNGSSIDLYCISKSH